MRQKSSVPAATLKDWPDRKWSLAALPNQTAEKVIRASEELFAKCGYNACTFKMISARSKVNQGLIYYYFGSKENLFSEIFACAGPNPSRGGATLCLTSWKALRLVVGRSLRTSSAPS